MRPVPCPPDLVVLLRAHLDRFPPGLDGRLFSGVRGGAVKESVYTEVWQGARGRALTPNEVASALVRRPDGLRHSCVSMWLAAGVDSARIATRVGHSAAVLHRVYAHVVPGRDEIARQRIEAVLMAPSASNLATDGEPAAAQDGDSGQPQLEQGSADGAWDRQARGWRLVALGSRVPSLGDLRDWSRVRRQNVRL